MTDYEFKVGDRVELTDEPNTAGTIKRIFPDPSQHSKDVIIVRVVDEVGRFDLSVMALNLRPSGKL